MKVLGLVDAYFFGTQEEQNGFDQREKLWYYLPISFVVAVGLFIKVTTGF